jgi:hypothetical protein
LEGILIKSYMDKSVVYLSIEIIGIVKKKNLLQAY